MPSLCPDLQSKLAAHLDAPSSDIIPSSLNTPKAHETDRQHAQAGNICKILCDSYVIYHNAAHLKGRVQ